MVSDASDLTLPPESSGSPSSEEGKDDAFVVVLGGDIDACFSKTKAVDSATAATTSSLSAVTFEVPSETLVNKDSWSSIVSSAPSPPLPIIAMMGNNVGAHCEAGAPWQNRFSSLLMGFENMVRNV